MQNQLSSTGLAKKLMLAGCPYCKGLSPTCVRCDDGGYSEDADYRPLRLRRTVSPPPVPSAAMQQRDVLLKKLCDEVFNLKGLPRDKSALRSSIKLIKSFKRLDSNLKKDPDLIFWLQKLTVLAGQRRGLFRANEYRR